MFNSLYGQEPFGKAALQPVFFVAYRVSLVIRYSIMKISLDLCMFHASHRMESSLQNS